MSDFPNKSLSGSTPKPNPVCTEILPLTLVGPFWSNGGDTYPDKSHTLSNIDWSQLISFKCFWNLELIYNQ